MFDFLSKQPTWLICLIISLYGVLKMIKDDKLTSHGKIAFWTIEIFFILNILIMIKELLAI